MGVAMVVAGACSSGGDSPAVQPGVAETTSSTMSFAECQKSGEYPGGSYAVEYDNGVCTVQKP